MYAKHDKYSLTTDKSQRFYPCLSFSCKYWGIFAKHHNMCERFLYLPGSQKATRHFHGEVPAMKDCKQCFNSTLHVLLHSNGLHDELNCHRQEKKHCNLTIKEPKRRTKPSLQRFGSKVNKLIPVYIAHDNRVNDCNFLPLGIICCDHAIFSMDYAICEPRIVKLVSY